MNKKNVADPFKLPDYAIFESNIHTDPYLYYYRPFVGHLFRTRTKQLLSLLTPPYGSILEAGYGNGILLPSLAVMSSDVHGIDIDSDPQKVSQNLKKINTEVSLKRGDIRNTHYPDNSFDLIVAVSMIYYFAEPKPVIDEIARILKPGGSLLIGMPRTDALMDKLFRLIGFSNFRKSCGLNHKQFLKASQSHFELKHFRKFPTFLPSSLGLYFSMLLHKRPK